MPCVLPLVEEAPPKVDGANNMEHVTLWLPSVLMKDRTERKISGGSVTGIIPMQS